jgi:hypothetical protein
MEERRLEAIALRIAQYGAVWGQATTDTEEAVKDYADILRAGLWEEVPVDVSDRARPFASAVVADLGYARLHAR